MSKKTFKERMKERKEKWKRERFNKMMGTYQRICYVCDNNLFYDDVGFTWMCWDEQKHTIAPPQIHVCVKCCLRYFRESSILKIKTKEEFLNFFLPLKEKLVQEKEERLKRQWLVLKCENIDRSKAMCHD